MKKRLSVALSALLLTLFFSGCAQTPAETGLGGSKQGTENGVIQEGNLEQQKNTITVEYSYQYTNMRLKLPLSWEYDILAGAGDEEIAGGSKSADYFGIQFWPQAEPSMAFRLYYHVNGIGLCGTGVTFEDISFENGLTATKCTESIDDGFWFFLIYHDVPGSYAVECSSSKGQWSEYENAVMSILESLEIGTGILSETEAIEIAKAKCSISYDTVRAHFDYINGVWEIRFSATNIAGGNQTIWIDAQGEIQSIVSGELISRR